MPFKPGMLDAEARAKWVAILRQAVAAAEPTATDTCFFLLGFCVHEDVAQYLGPFM